MWKKLSSGGESSPGVVLRAAGSAGGGGWVFGTVTFGLVPMRASGSHGTPAARRTGAGEGVAGDDN